MRFGKKWMVSVSAIAAVVGFNLVASAIAQLDTHIDLTLVPYDQPAALAKHVRYEGLDTDEPNGPPLTSNGLGDELRGQLNGGNGYVAGWFEVKDLAIFPHMKLEALALAPPHPEEYGQPFGGYYAKVDMSFEDYVRVDLLHSSVLVAAVGVKYHMHGSLLSRIVYNPYEAQEHAWTRLDTEIVWGDTTLKSIWDRAGTYDENGNPIFNSFEPVLAWDKEADIQGTLPGVQIFNETHIKFTWKAQVNADNGVVGPTTAGVTALDTFAIDGLIPYDAQGNVLPSSYLVVVSEGGWTYNILGSDVPEPAAGFIVLPAALAFIQWMRFRRKE